MVGFVKIAESGQFWEAPRCFCSSGLMAKLLRKQGGVEGPVLQLFGEGM